MVGDISGCVFRVWTGLGGLIADHSLSGVHIHFCGNGGYGLRPYGVSLGKAPSNQGLLPLSFGASLWLG
ncbi:hypothetical protein ACIPL2_12565, partial [Pseudomonas sp. NPDC086251]